MTTAGGEGETRRGEAQRPAEAKGGAEILVSAVAAEPRRFNSFDVREFAAAGRAGAFLLPHLFLSRLLCIARRFYLSIRRRPGGELEEVTKRLIRERSTASA